MEGEGEWGEGIPVASRLGRGCLEERRSSRSGIPGSQQSTAENKNNFGVFYTRETTFGK